MINGKDIFISVRNADGTFYPVACDSSCTISVDRPVMNVTGPGDGLWRRIIPGNRISASINGNGLINFDKHTSLYVLQRLLIEGTLVYLMCEIETTNNGLVSYECNGYITKMELTGAYRAAGSFTYNIEIDGEILMDSTVIVGEETGNQNLLIVDSSGELFDIDNNDNGLIE